MIALIAYLESHDPKDWSYMEFLRLNRATIVDVPPFSDDWTGNHGAWSRRYLWAVSEINPKLNGSEKEKVISFHAFSGKGALHTVTTGCRVYGDYRTQVLVVEASDTVTTGSAVYGDFRGPTFATRFTLSFDLITKEALKL